MSDTSMLKEPESLDEIGDFYAEAAPVGTYEIFLPSGRPITCRYPHRYGEISQFTKGVKEFAKVWSDPENLLPDLKPLAPLEWSEAWAAYLLHFWSDDSTKISQRTAVKLTKNAWVMDSLRRQIEANQKVSLELIALQEIADAKKGSRETASHESGSGSASTNSGDTPTP